MGDTISPDDEWYVELDGKAVAILSNPRDADMFWFTWDIHPASPNQMIPSDLWLYESDTRRGFRHRFKAIRDDFAIPSTNHPNLADSRVLLRGPLCRTTEHPSRRGFSFSLRTLFVVVTVFCFGIGWVCYQLDWIKQRHNALQTIGIQGNPNSRHTIYDKPYSPNGLWLLREKGQSTLVIAKGEIANERIEELRPLLSGYKSNSINWLGRVGSECG